MDPIFDMFVNFVLNLILIVVGGFIAQYTVNLYQRKRESAEIREEALKAQLNAFNASIQVLRTWNDWLDGFQRFKTMEKDKNLEEEMKRIQRRLEEAIAEFKGLEGLMVGRFEIQFDLTPSVVEKLMYYREKFNSLLTSIHEVTTERQEPPSDIRFFFDKVDEYLRFSYTLVLQSKISI
jgi:hypothetical protein